MESKWIEFQKLKKPVGRKTDIYHVVTKDGNTLLGMISWYAAWRCYSFSPNSRCVFETQCLKDIVAFIERLMLDRKLQKQKEQFHKDNA